MKLSDVKIGQRHRRDMGDIAALAESIKRVGTLLHPIVVDASGKLIAGERRVEAYKLLGWKDIPHTTVTTLEGIHAALLAERDENTQRKDFTPSEAVAMAEALRPFEEAAAKERMAEGGSRPKGGKIFQPLPAPPADRSNGKPPPDEDARARTARHVGLGPTAGNGRSAPPSPGYAAAKEFLDAEFGRRPAAPVRAADKVAEAVGMSRPTLAKATDVVEAAKADPEHFGDLPAQMDETGKVDPVHKELVRRAVEHPLPEGKTPRQQAAESPAVKWSQLVTRLWQLANSVRHAGGMRKIAAKWSDDDRSDYCKQLRKLRHEINLILNDLDGSPVEDTPVKEGSNRAKRK